MKCQHQQEKKPRAFTDTCAAVPLNVFIGKVATVTRHRQASIQ